MSILPHGPIYTKTLCVPSPSGVLETQFHFSIGGKNGPTRIITVGHELPLSPCAKDRFIEAVVLGGMYIPTGGLTQD